MSDNVGTNNSSSLLCPSQSGFKNEKEKHPKVTKNHISKLVEEMIEITCKNVSKEVETTLCISNKNKKEQKFSNSANVTVESDMPVRRSNRIRRSVVKKDEFVTPRSKKTNKTSKNIETNNLKIASETDDTDSNNNPSDILSKDNTDKSPSNKVHKSSKAEKKQKSLQGSDKRSVQAEKKKPTRKKKCAKNEDISNDNINNDNESKSEKSDTSSELQIASDSKASDNDTNSEYIKAENNALSKTGEDQNCEMNDKSSESCNIKPVKVKSRWWRSSELEAVKNSESVTTDNIVAPCAIKVETTDSPLTICAQTAVTAISIKTEPNDSPLIPTVKIKEEMPKEPVIDDKKTDSTDNANSPSYEHIEENIYRFERYFFLFLT